MYHVIHYKGSSCTCKACPGFAHAYTPGVASTDTGRSVKISLEGNNVIGGIGTHYFYETDIGAKLISNGGLYNWYIESIDIPQASAPKRMVIPHIVRQLFWDLAQLDLVILINMQQQEIEQLQIWMYLIELLE